MLRVAPRPPVSSIASPRISSGAATSSANATRSLPTSLVELGHHDRPRTRRPQHLRGEDADRPGAEHDGDLGEAVGNEAQRVDAGRQRLAEHGDARVEVARKGMRARERDGDELREAAGPAAADEPAAGADVLPSRAAGEAAAAGDLRIHRHAGADEGFSPVAACGDDLAAELVAHDERRRPPRAPRRDAVQVGAADAGRLDPHEHLLRSRPRGVDALHLELERRRVEQRLHRPLVRCQPAIGCVAPSIRSHYRPAAAEILRSSSRPERDGSMRFDLLLKGGEVVDPGGGASGALDVAIVAQPDRGGRPRDSRRRGGADDRRLRLDRHAGPRRPPHPHVSRDQLLGHPARPRRIADRRDDLGRRRVAGGDDDRGVPGERGRPGDGAYVRLPEHLAPRPRQPELGADEPGLLRRRDLPADDRPQPRSRRRREGADRRDDGRDERARAAPPGPPGGGGMPAAADGPHRLRAARDRRRARAPAVRRHPDALLHGLHDEDRRRAGPGPRVGAAGARARRAHGRRPRHRLVHLLDCAGAARAGASSRTSSRRTAIS